MNWADAFILAVIEGLTEFLPVSSTGHMILASAFMGIGSSVDDVTYLDPFKIGWFQCLAMIPGVSRSGATIVGGMRQNMSRKVAAEFSFFLAVPTMLGATLKKTMDYLQKHDAITADQINLLKLGNIVAFIVAALVIKGFIAFLNKHGFRIFSWYRIIVGSTILLLLAQGTDLRVL